MNFKNLLPKGKNGCPYLIIAPMEGVGDRSFRKAMREIGGFDEAVTEFLRVPTNAHVKSLAVRYESQEITPFPLAAQIMGSDPELLGAMAFELQERGAPRIDLNCGCPSNTVTGRGAGSSLLKDPDLLYKNAHAMCRAVNLPVTVKMRSGYEDISLFKENLIAAEESGVSFITLHPRTKVDGYGPPARWDLIREAKSLLKIPLVGNGDIVTVDDAIKMLDETACDALMIGRGCVINPYIFHEIKSRFAKEAYLPSWESLERYFAAYLAEIPVESPTKNKINKMKQLMSLFFKANERLLARRQEMLTQAYPSLDAFMHYVLAVLKDLYYNVKK